jgi:hypothetical protein
MLSVERRWVKKVSQSRRLRLWKLWVRSSTEERMGVPDSLMSLLVIGVLEVKGSWEGVEGAVIFVAPVGKLLAIVVAAVVEVGFWGPGFWVVVGVEDILSLSDEGFLISVFSKV